MNAKQLIDSACRVSENSAVVWFYYNAHPIPMAEGSHGGENPGVMICMPLPQDVREKLAFGRGPEGIVPSEEMHVTLAYLGRLNDIGGMDTVNRAKQAVWELAAITPIMHGTVNGVGRFAGTKSSDGKDVLYSSIDIPGLSDFRTDLVRALEISKVPVKKEHGYVPHATLAYIDAAQPGFITMPDAARQTPIPFEKVNIVIGDRGFSSHTLRGKPVDPYA